MGICGLPMRICLVYDCLFPHTVGGAERWYRNLAERLAADGHEVTYLTLRQWERGDDPGVTGVDVQVVGPRMELYDGPGHRRILPPLVFGAGVLWHLLRHGRRYDVVHTCSFPYFALLAAALVAPIRRYGVVVDWFEVWSRAYWREYLGMVGGTVGWLVQRLCARVPQRAFCFSQLYARRLRDEGLRGKVSLLGGIYEKPRERGPVQAAEPLVLFAGRHIPEKQTTAIPAAIARARLVLPSLRAVILGDGPERGTVTRLVAEMGLAEAVEVPGFVDTAVIEDLMSRALCLLLPSRREGYGLVIVEASSMGTPSIVVAGPDNASVELMSEGENGYIVPSAAADVLAEAIVRVHGAGYRLRESTAAWFEKNADWWSLEHSLQVVVRAYDREPSAPA
jgi:glycosyltransferase involved in cell wall biosynthesis